MVEDLILSLLLHKEEVFFFLWARDNGEVAIVTCEGKRRESDI